jgi:hypothetical protein
MKVDGACHCGRISFEAEIDSTVVVLCHCTDCQSLSGSPYRAVVVARSERVALRGGPKVYVKTAESGNRLAQAFCPGCGSPIYGADPEKPAVFNIRLGAIRQRRELGPPSRQIWCDSALPWAMDLASVPRVAR